MRWSWKIGRLAGIDLHLHVTFLALVKSDRESLSVHVGPERFLASEGIAFKVDDRVAITGSRVKVDGAPALIASEIAVGGKSVTLRDKDGVPRWAGRRMRPGS